ncbi:MAG: hypothetical protein HY903_02720 [Deltaproteobacteria bacterium]|nr:hypothetical protein [Deltaproteobacteria bacterium]
MPRPAKVDSIGVRAPASRRETAPVGAPAGKAAATARDQGAASDELVKSGQSAATRGAALRGVREAEILAAFKAVVGGTSLDSTGTKLKIRDDQITEAELQAAVKRMFGKTAELGAGGTFDLLSGAVGADVAGRFKALYGAVALDVSGDLALKAGALSADLRAKLEKTFGASVAVTDGKLRFQSGVLTGSLNERLTTTFGPNASITPSFFAGFDKDGLETASVGLAAFKRLKVLEAGGSVALTPDGKITIKDGKLDRAELSLLVATIFGERASLDTQGRVVFAGGKTDLTLSAKLATAVAGTRLDASGTLRLAGGAPEATVAVNGLFPGIGAKAGATLAIKGADEVKVGLKLSALGAGTRVSGDGTLSFGPRAVEAGLTTNLVVGASDDSALALGGLVTVADGRRAAELNAKLHAGLLSGAVGIGTESAVELYRPTAADAGRQAIAKAGGFWSLRTASFDAKGEVGVGATVMLGAVPLTLGFGANGTTRREVRALTIHPTEADATEQARFTVLRPPQSVAAVLAMQPFEMISEAGTQALGFRGQLAVGIAQGAARLAAGGELYYQTTGELSRDIERLAQSRVRVRFRRGAGKLDVKALSASVGLQGPGVAGASTIGQQLAPTLQQVAEVGLRLSFERLNQGDSCFDFTFDLSTPQGALAFSHALANELGEAQHWAEYEGSGVQLNAAVDTHLAARTRTAALSLGPLQGLDVDRLADKVSKTLTPGNVVFGDAVERDSFSKSILPWKPSERVTVKFVRETEARKVSAAPAVPAAATVGPLAVRRLAPPTPGQAASRARSLLGVRVRLEDKMTSLDDLQRGYLQRTVTLLRLLGASAADYERFAALDRALACGAAPPQTPIVPWFGGIGDKRFGATALDWEGFIAPRGFLRVFERPRADGNGFEPRPRADFFERYVALEAALETGAAPATGDASRPQVDDALRARAQRFAEHMAAAVRVFERHRSRDGDGPLVDDPAQYYHEMQDVLREVMKNDGDRVTGALTLLRLASPDGVFVRAELQLAPETIKAVITAGRKTVQRFAAVAVLAGLEGSATDLGATGPRQARWRAAAGAARRVWCGGAGAPSELPAAVTELLARLSIIGGELRLPGAAATDQVLLDHALGAGVAQVVGDRVVFDNRGYGFVNFADALLEAFGPGVFGAKGSGDALLSLATVAPVGEQPATQAWDSLAGELVVRHRGNQASWKFSPLGNLRGAADDFMKSGAPTPAWILKG